MAAVFERYLPLMEPVGRAVLDQLPPLADQATVLDVACGTGEPGLTLARRSPSVGLLGVDGAIEVARVKAAREGLNQARFEVMAAEPLACDDHTFDAVISRFGPLMFGDAVASARELWRVLRIGDAFSLAVWDDMATNTLVGAVIAALRSFVPAELIAAFETMPGALAGERLREVGVTDAQPAPFRWEYELPGEALWEFVSGPGIFARHFAALEERDRLRVHEQVSEALAAYRRPGRGYRIPHVCRLWWGRR